MLLTSSLLLLCHVCYKYFYWSPFCLSIVIFSTGNVDSNCGISPPHKQTNKDFHDKCINKLMSDFECLTSNNWRVWLLNVTLVAGNSDTFHIAWYDYSKIKPSKTICNISKIRLWRDVNYSEVKLQNSKFDANIPFWEKMIS